MTDDLTELEVVNVRSGNRQFISKLDAQVLVFLKKSDYIVSASRLDRGLLTQIRRWMGLKPPVRWLPPIPPSCCRRTAKCSKPL